MNNFLEWCWGGPQTHTEFSQNGSSPPEHLNFAQSAFVLHVLGWATTITFDDGQPAISNIYIY